MPSPFPGMDPYLESDLWTSFHSMFASEVVAALNPLLAPRYLAFSEKYHLAGHPEDVFIESRAIIPDVGVQKVPSAPSGTSSVQAIGLAAPLVVKSVMTLPIPHVRVLIRDVKNKLLVTVLEFLSPTNKRNPGRKKYLRRRARVLSSSTHLLEIDLVRKGRRLPTDEVLPDVPYFAFLSRGERRPLTEVWPISLRDPLPSVPVPLLPGDSDVPLDLQRVFTATYDRAYFGVAIDYLEPPPIPLAPADQTWVEGLLRTAGKRP